MPCSSTCSSLRAAAPAAAPYAALQPAAVLDALHAAGFDADGRLLQLNSYENRVWQAHLEDGRVVVAKFYRPGRWSDAQIAEEHAFCRELAAADAPVVAPLVLTPRDATALRLDPATPTLGHFFDRRERGAAAWRIAVAERRAGRAPELEQPATLAWLGRMLARLHAVGQRRRFTERLALTPASYGHAARQRLIDGGFVRPETEGAWLAASAAALAEVDAAFARLGNLRTLRLHGDCHAGNVLWRDEGAHAGPNLVDFDDCCTGPAVQDLWLLLPGERGAAADAALQHLLAGYRAFMPFDERELRLIEPLRTLRMIHHSAWLAGRWGDPAFPIAFAWFASPAYWQQQASELREQTERMQS